MLPYSRQAIDQDDIDAVVEVLKSDWLTTGPTVALFENAVADYVNARHGVAYCNGTAALHAAMAAAGIGPGDEVIVPAITFVATANAVLYCGGTPVFADVAPGSLLLDPADVVRKVSSRTRAIVAMDYAGQTCDYPRLKQVADQNGLKLIADACHSVGARSCGRHVPGWVDAACYSFHPVKPFTTCEGGMVVTDQAEMATTLRHFRNHGITTDHHQRDKSGTCSYDMQSLGYNYRLSDVHCALGLTQVKKLPNWTRQRTEIANEYRQLLRGARFCKPLDVVPGAGHAYHLFVVRWCADSTGITRDQVIVGLRENGIRANIHYRPVYQHSFYQERNQHLRIHRCPNAEQVFPQLISLPIFPSMTVEDVRFVVNEMKTVIDGAKPDDARERVA